MPTHCPSMYPPSVKQMDLRLIIQDSVNRSGQSPDDGPSPGDSKYPDYLHSRPHVAIPYLSLLSAATVCGTLGNTLVIGVVLVNKVGRLHGYVC